MSVFSYTFIRGTKAQSGDCASTPQEHDLLKIISSNVAAELRYARPREATTPIDETVTWSYRGIEGYGTRPDIVGTFSGPLVIAGCARNVWEDLEKCPRTIPIMAINDIGVYLPIVHHWLSMHDDILLCMNETRARIKRPEPHMLHSSYGTRRNRLDREDASNQILWPVQRTARYDLPTPACHYWHLNAQCSVSGVFATLIALLLGYEDIILAGIPATSIGAFYDPIQRQGPHGNARYIRRWEATVAQYSEVANCVRSLSGNTRELLGPPAW